MAEHELRVELPSSEGGADEGEKVQTQLMMMESA